MGVLERWESRLDGMISREDISFGPSAASVYGPGVMSEAGSPVSAETALGIPGVAACVELISSTVASLPVRVFDRSGNRVEHRVVGGEASPDQSWAELVQGLVSDALLYGNGYASVQRDSLGRAQALHYIPRSACDVTCDVLRSPDGRIRDRRFVLQWKDMLPTAGSRQELMGENVLDVRGDGWDGVKSRGVITQFRQQLGQILSAERFAGRMFTGFTGTTAVVLPFSSEKDQMKEIAREFEQRHEGIDRSHSTVVLDSNAKVEQLSFAPREAQLIEGRRYLVEAVAKMFSVPLGFLEYSSSSGVPVAPTERDMILFAETTVQRWVDRVVHAVYRVFSMVGKVEMENGHIVVADSRTRSAAATMFTQAGVLSLNELRAREDLPPLEDPVADDPIEYLRQFGSDRGGAEEGHPDNMAESETGNPIADSSPDERP